MDIVDSILSGIGFECRDGTVSLFHGSKSGLHGEICPGSRENCDFGSGFYMGTKKWQVLDFVYRRENPWFYEISLDMTDLSVMRLSGLAWALFIARNRKPGIFSGMEPVREWIDDITARTDVVIGPIADNDILVLLNKFIEGNISIEALAIAMSRRPLGIQYVAKTESACSAISILRARPVERKEWDLISEHASVFKTGPDASLDAGFIRKDQHFLMDIINTAMENLEKLYGCDALPSCRGNEFPRV